METAKQTVVYKTVGDCQIKLDVYLPQGKARCPAIVWIHGGALIFGSRANLPPEQLDLYLKAGYAVFSIDYRLAPETKLQAILEDVRDAYDWVQSRGPELFEIDPGRLAVIGHSGGGYLALACGFLARPRAIVSFYGYGDIVQEWYTRPDPHYNLEPAVTPQTARQGVGGPIIAGVESAESARQRWAFYLYCRQQGLWPLEVAGYDPDAQRSAFARFNPVENVSPSSPPTLFLHGDQDTDVPFSASEQMATVLREQHVPHRLIRMAGYGHGFDYILREPPTDEAGRKRRGEVERAFEEVLLFLQDNLGR